MPMSFGRAIAALSLVFAMAACSGGGGRAPCPAGLRCLEAGNAAEPLTLDPSKAQNVWESNILYDLFIGLTQWNDKGEVEPGMATSWDVSADGLTWTFHLRDAQWSDGVPVTADDFVYALQRLEAPATASPYAYLLYLITGAQAVNEGKARPETIGAHALDPHTLQLTLTHPAPYLPRLLVHSSAMPLPAHVVRRWGDAWLESAHFVSNGPYVLKAWLLGQRVILTRNPYFHEPLCFDQISYYPTSDFVTAERRVANGEFDMTYTFSLTRTRYLRQHMPAYTHGVPYLANWYLSMNQRVPKLRDLRVRLALSLGIDREFLANKLMGGGTQALYSFTPPGLLDYQPPPSPVWSHWPFAQRQAAARALLREAGYGPDHPLQLEFKFGDTAKISATALQADWHAIGLDVTLMPEESQILYADLNAGNFDIAWDGWAMDYDDPMTFLELLDSQAGSQNHSHYASARYDALLDQADHTRDLARRAQILAQAEGTALSDLAIAPIITDAARYLVNPDITGWVDNPANWHLKRYLCRKGPPPGGT